MFWLLQAGLVAAGRQIVAVAVITLMISLLESNDILAGACVFSVSPFLSWAYVLVAAGFAFSWNRCIDVTADRIRRASRLMSMVEPGEVSKKLAVQLCLTAIMFALLTLRPPPDFLIAAGQYVSSACATSIAWAGTMSSGVACFGASAHAAFKAR